MFGEDPPEDRPGLGVDTGFFNEAMEIFKDLEVTEPAAVKEFLAAHGLDELCELQAQENGSVVIWPSRLLLEFLARMGRSVDGTT